MSQQWDEKSENLRELLRQHWLHCRHLESERAWFMSVYAAIIGGVAAFVTFGSTGDSSVGIEGIGLHMWWLVCFLVILTFVGFFLTIRWTHAFESHRVKVNKISRVLWSTAEVDISLDPTMNIPPLHIFPDIPYNASFPWYKKIYSRFTQFIDETFRTKYWFALFYFFILVLLTVLTNVDMANLAPFPVWFKVVTIIVSILAFTLGVRWWFALREIKRENEETK